MPRTPSRRLGAPLRRQYTTEALENALRLVIEQNYSFRQAAERYGVPRNTLFRKYHGKNSDRLGRPPVFSPLEENKLVKAITYAAECGFPLTELKLRKFVKNFLDRKGAKIDFFQDNLPGKDWVKCFQQRHKKLTTRLSENVKRNRAEIDEDAINNFFDNLVDSLGTIAPANLVNYDETNLCDDPGSEKVLIRRGSKHATRIIDTSKSSVSVMFAGTADGNLLPPYIVYKAVNLYPEWIENGPPGTHYNRSKSGWFDNAIFEDWFCKIALPYFRSKKGPKALIGDNLASHLSPFVLQKCEENGIKFILLLPNSTHVCQPLDIAFFRPLKMTWRKVIMEWKLKNRGVIPKTVFPSLLNKTLTLLKTQTSNNLIAGFRSAGLFPLNRAEVLKHLPKSRREPVEDDDPLLQSFADIVNSNDSTPPVLYQRKRKLNVAPGKSVTTSDLNNANTHEEIERESSADEEEERILSSLNNEDEEPQPSTSGVQFTNASDARVPVETETLSKDKFVIAGFLYNQGTKKEHKQLFVAQITQVLDSNMIEINCLRAYMGKKDTFIFPNIPDICRIHVKDITYVLKNPLATRGRYIFESDVL